MKGTINFSFSKQDLKQFEASCEIAIRNVGRGTRKATEAACIEILTDSRAQVPVETLNLLLSSFYEVARRTDTAASTWAYEAIVGYGGNGDPINPRTGKQASYYMMAVHEDLQAVHTTGKAKFLEDPVRAYAKDRFPRTVFRYAQESLAYASD